MSGIHDSVSIDFWALIHYPFWGNSALTSNETALIYPRTTNLTPFIFALNT